MSDDNNSIEEIPPGNQKIKIEEEQKAYEPSHEMLIDAIKFEPVSIRKLDFSLRETTL